MHDTFELPDTTPFNQHTKQSAKQKARFFHRDNARRLLERHGISFWSQNDGIHMIVSGHYQLIDFWPSTGRWKTRDQYYKGSGIQGLIEMIDSRQI